MRLAVFFFLTLAAFATQAQTAAATGNEEKRRIEKIKEEARTIRNDADLAYKAKKAECARRALKLPGDCLSDVREANKIALAKARILEDQAADLEPIGDDEKAALRAQIAQLRDRAGAIKSEAERSFKAREGECYGKFLVNSCIDEAKDARLTANAEARELEQLARDVERQLKKRELVNREIKRQEKALRQEADNARNFGAQPVPTPGQ